MDGYDYVVQLVDQISGPAKTAKQQIDSLTSGLKAQSTEIAEAQALMSELASQGALTASAEAQLQAGIDKATKSMDQQTKQIRALLQAEQDEATKAVAADQKKIAAEQKAAAAAQDEATKAVKAEQSKIAAQQQEAKALQDEAAQQHKAGEEASGFNETLEASMAYLVAFAAIVAAVAVALGGLFLGGAKLALDASQFKTQSTAALQSYLGSSQAAQATYKQIEGISDTIGISNARAQDLGMSLLQAGVKQNQLGDAISGIAELEKVRGADAANKLQKVIETSAVTGKMKFSAKQFVGTGLTEADLVTQLAKNLKQAPATIKAELEKGKISATDGTKAINDVLKTQLGDTGFTSFGDAVSKIQEKFTRLFEDVNTKPFLAALKEISTWFDGSTVQGAALKWLFETIFNGAFASAQTLLPYLKTGFLEIVIVALKIYIAMKPVIAAFEDLGKQLGITGGQGDTLMKVIVGTIDFAGEFVIIFVTGILYIVELITLLVSWFKIAESAVSSLGSEFGAGLSDALATLENIFSAANGSSLATDLISGLVNGIIGGIPNAIGAMKDLGSSAIDAIRNTLGTHSPSTVMGDVGHDTVDGFDNAVDSRTDGTQAKLANVIAPPSAAPAGGGGGASVTVGPGAVVVTIGGGASATPQQIQSAVEAALAEMTESIIMQLGGAAAPGVT